MKKLILLLFTLSFALCTFSQEKGWQKGYIVNNGIDTIEGFIRTNNLTGFYKIQFKKQLIDRYTVYESKDLKSYTVGENCYKSILIPEEITGVKNYVLTKQLSGDDIRLYFSKYKYFSCPCEPEGAVNEGYIVIKNDSITIINKKSFSEKIRNPLDLIDLLKDKDGSWINTSFNELKFADIPLFIKEYNVKK
ncbi:MAG: hypothetical protein A2033_05365 [Bacteroidetes bacterium GWA2_31_9]|nr:MAG: hypothetical protein A2033_05365 [Bacteroidetes bacterium GWA2_31_9]